MGSERIHSGEVAAEVARLKLLIDQGRLTSAATIDFSSRSGRIQGGAATPPYRVKVGRTCRSAVTSCEQAKLSLRPPCSSNPNLSHHRALSSARPRLGLRREAPLCGAPDSWRILKCSDALESGAAAALCTAVQDAGAHIVRFGNFRIRQSVRPSAKQVECLSYLYD